MKCKKYIFILCAAGIYSFASQRFFTRHCHWCCITAAFPVSIRGQGHLDTFSSTTKKFYCTLISCTAPHTCVLFNHSHCFIESWWNLFGPQRPLGFHLWEPLVFLTYRQGCSPGSDARVRPDPWGQAASRESRDLPCSASSEKLRAFPPCWKGTNGLPEATTCNWNRKTWLYW